MEPDVMMSHFNDFNAYVHTLMNDTNTSLQEKISALATLYIDVISAYPEVTPYILTTVKSNPDEISSKMNLVLDVNETVMSKQIREMTKGNKKEIHPSHFVMNIISMCVFPLIAGPMVRKYSKLDNDAYRAMMQERKTLIPLWTQAMITMSN